MPRPALLVLCTALLAVCSPAAAQSPDRPGLLLLAHGGQPAWNARVLDLAARVGSDQPIEVAFGMASRPAIQKAIDALVARGATRVVAIPLFVSSHSSVVTSTEYLLGLRAEMPPDLRVFARMRHGSHGAPASHEHHAAAAAPEDNTRPVVSPVPIQMTPALNRHALVGEILIDRARSISQSPSEEAVILVAHGPVPDDDNARWLADMDVLAAQMRAATTFGSIDALTVRDDAPAPIRDAASAELRALVERRVADGRRVLIVPLLLSYGGIEQGIRKRLDGLPYAMPDQGLAPDDRLVTWVRAMAAAAGVPATVRQ
ncbi:MAG: CbiX/SirB N-terminal domain-containing protein [Acidobacteriota bacterium]